jgi:tetratricopeptide (TPR) repeat protein
MGGDLELGAVVRGRYRVVRVLGRGGASTTYEVEALADGRALALKWLSVGAARDWKVLELFEREANVLSQLHHPAIPRYVEHFAEEGPDVAFGIVQELAPGRSLAQWVAAGWRPTEAEIEGVAHQVLRVLDDIHGRHPPLVHRDLKPQNLIRADDGTVRVVDFGGVRDTLRTQTGGSTVVGTYGYMPPEQFRGAAVPASDLYGLGATVVFLLTGVAPTDLPQKKLTIDFRSRVKVSPALAAWLDKMLAPAPEDRFQSAHEAATALAARRVPKSKTAVVRLAALLAGLVAVTGLAAVVGVRELRARAVVAKAAQAAPAPASLPTRPFAAASLLDGCTSFSVGRTTMDLALGGVGARFVTATDEGPVKLWRVDGAAERTFVGHQGRVWSVAFSADGRTILSGGADKTLRVWNAATAEQVRAIDVGASVRRVQSTPDGSRWLTASEDGNARIWDAASGALLHTLHHGRGDAMMVALHPDGQTVFTTGDDPVVRTWDLATGAPKESYRGHGAPVAALAFIPGGKSFVTGSDDGVALVWDRDAATPTRRFVHQASPIWTLGVSDDGRWLAAGGKGHRSVVFDLKSGAIRAEVAGAQCIRTMFVGGQLLLATTGGEVLRCAVRARSKPKALPGPRADVPPYTPPVAHDPEEELLFAARAEIDTYPVGSLERAEKYLRGALAKNPKSARAHAGLSRQARLRGYVHGDEYDKAQLAVARAECAKAIALDPKLAEAHVADARLALAEKDVARAAAAVAVAKKLAPADPMVGLVELQLAEARSDPEVDALFTALVEGTRSPWVLYQAYQAMGEVYRARRDLAGREAVYLKLLELEPKNPWPHGNYAEYLLGLGEHDAAFVEATRALELMDYGAGRSTLAGAHAGRGMALLWDDGRLPEAKAEFERAVALAPDTWSGHYGLAACYRKQAIETHDLALVERAERELRLALKIEPSDRDTAVAIVELASIRTWIQRTRK